MATDNHTSETPSKTCTKCGIEKPATAEYFNKHPQGKNGLHPQCRICRAIDRNSVPIEVKTKVDFKSCPLCSFIYPVSYFYKSVNRKYAIGSLCISCTKTKVKEWGEANYEPKLRIPKAKPSPDVVKEKQKIRSREWYVRNTQRAIQSSKEYKERNPEQHALQVYLGILRRRARKQSLPDSFSKSDYQQMVDYWSGRCVYCDKKSKLEADHFIALSDSHCPGTIPKNMLPACKSCNVSKFNHPPQEWLIREYGGNKADKILKRIQDYFNQL